MTNSEKERNRIQDEFSKLQSENDEFNSIDLSMHLARVEDLPDLGSLELYDYESDMEIANAQSLDILESLTDLYLSDVPKLKEHSYIQHKMKEDAKIYAETIFLQKMTRKALLNQMRQIDNGDNSARMHEILNQTIGQVRENSKFSSTQKTELEKFYKELRADMGLNELETPSITDKNNEIDEVAKDDGEIMDNRKLNDLIKNALIERKEEKKRKDGKK